MKRMNRPLSRALGLESLEDRRMLAVVPNGFTETVVASEMTSPVTLDIEDGGRIWVAYQDGRIGVIENDSLLPNLAYQLDCDGSAEHGLQGIELDPHFEHNNYIYVYYTANSPQAHNRLSRLTVDPTTENTILLGSEVVLLDLPDLSTYGNPPWHIGGAIHFAPDGTLRVQIGESQQAALSQDMESPLGKILRVNADGSIPTDNPFYNAGDGITWRDRIWASGLRNPFAGDLDSVTGRYFVADVGNGAWEEINDATDPGKNFGWPSTEGMFNPVSFPNFTNPVHAYPHSTGCAITGAAFNTGGVNQFPAQYDGKFFFSEFCGGEIRVIDPNNPASAQVFATDAAYPMNIEFAPDGSMYYISRGAGAGGAPGIGTGTVRKVQYSANVAPQIVLNPIDQLASVGYDVSFTASAAGTTPLAFQWQRFNGTTFVNVDGATAATLLVADVSLADNGAQFRVVVTNGFGTATSSAATLSVTADTPPTPVIDLPPSGLTYRAGDTINFSGSASDLEDRAMAASALTWSVDFHHNVHSHPLIPPTSGTTSGQFTIPTVTETAHDVWYRINLSVTDSAGLTTTTFRDVFPEKSDFVVETNLPGGAGDVLIDSLSRTAPHGVTGVVNVQRTVEVPATQQVGGTLGFFEQWIDGVMTRQRTISTPEDDKAYVALYRGVSGAPVYLSDLPIVGTPVNGWGPIELDTSNGEAAAGDGNPMTLNGVVYSKGLGVHALSEVVYDLAGGFSRFVSDVGVDDENAPGGSVVFQVFGDNVPLFDSGLMTNASATQTVNVDVTGVSQLRLVVTTGGDGDGADHADWADARLFSTDSDPLVNINFQLDAAATPATYLPDSGNVFGNRGNGWSYGWSSDHTDLDRDRDVNSDQRLDTLVHFHQGQNWEIALPNGSYLVTVAIGDAGNASTHTINVEGANYWNALPLGANQFATQTQLVSVSDGRLTLDQGAAAEKATRINYVQIAAAGAESSLLPFDVADVTLDGHLDQADLADFMAGWGKQHGAVSPEQLVGRGDLNFDQATDSADWAIMQAAWNAEYGSGSAPDIDHLVAALVGDFDHDGDVDGADLNEWKPGFGTSGTIGLAVGDADIDGDVDGADFLTWQRHLGEITPATTQSNPETGGGTVNVVAPATAEAARTALLAGVTNIAVSGSPGQIAVFDPPGAGAGQGAFSVIHDGDYRPMVAAAIWGSGKVVAFGHNGYVNFGGFGGSPETGQFFRNSIAWTTNSAGLGAAIVTNVAGTRDWLVGQGYTNVTLRSDWQNGLAGANLLIAEIGPGTTTAQQNALRTFVQAGGGLITGGTGWGYQQGGTNLVTMPGNVVLREAGIAWASGFRNGVTNATLRSTDLANASQALLFAQQLWAGGSGTAAQKEEAGRALQTVLTVLPTDHPLYVDINAAFTARAAVVAATPTTPVSDFLDQAVLTWESNRLASTPVAQVTAHHTADDVYGVIPANAPRVTDVATLHTVHHGNVTVNRWQATGFYAAPGEIVTVTVPASLVGRGYKIRINAHTDDISQRDTWERMPVVHRSFSIDQASTQVASAFGGSIFIDFGSGAVNVGDVPITIAGAIRQPYFVLGQHTNADWNNSLRNNPAPYGVLVSDNLIIVLPKHQIESANLTEPHELMTWWNQAVQLQDDLADQAKFRRSAEIINVDVQNSAGAAHAGFPIQAYQKHWGNLANWDNLQQVGSWGDFHELGHNHQRSWWTFAGDGEVTVNIFSNYALESLADSPQDAQGWGYSADPVETLQRAISDVSGGGTYSNKSDRWSFWFQLADGFGWNAYDLVFAGYETDAATNPSALPTNEQQRKDQWFTRWSNAVGYDMKRFMVDTWGLEVSQAAINAVSALPDWMPVATAVDDFQIDAGQSRVLNLAGGGLGMDGVATFVSATQPQHGVLTDNGNGTYTYAPNVNGGMDSFVVTYRSSANNVQAFTVNVTIGNGFLPGDVNIDGVLDMTDVNQFIANWRRNTAGLSDSEMIMAGDLNLSGVTDFADFFILHQAWNAQSSSSWNLAALLAEDNGDFNDDGRVDSLDLTVWRTTFATASPVSPALDGADLLTWQRNLNGGAPAAALSGAESEAATATLLVADPPQEAAFATLDLAALSAWNPAAGSLDGQAASARQPSASTVQPHEPLADAAIDRAFESMDADRSAKRQASAPVHFFDEIDSDDRRSTQDLALPDSSRQEFRQNLRRPLGSLRSNGDSRDFRLA